MNDAPKSEPAAPTRKPRRRWRWVRRVGASVLVSLVGYFIWVFVDRELTKVTGNRQLAEAQARTETADPDWTWERLNATRPKPPEGKNGADLIPRIKKLTPDTWGKEFAKTEWQADLEVPPNVRYAPRVLAQVRAELNGAAEAVALARALRECPFGYRTFVLAPNVFDTLLPETQNTRTAFDLLRWDAVLAVEDGNSARATEDLLALLNASRSLGDEPFIISQLVRMAGRSVTVQAVERLLAQTADAPGLAEVQAALAADAEDRLLLYGMRGERASIDRLFENIQNGVITVGQALDARTSAPWERLAWWHYRANIPAERAEMLERMTWNVEFARQPVHEQPALLGSAPEPSADVRRILLRLFLPPLDKAANAHWRATALERCAVLGIACERFRQKHHLWPNDLNELVPAFVSEIPLDPYDGRPLRYTKADSGVVVFSVGKRLANQARPGIPAPPPPPRPPPHGIEIGFRLWDPDRRQQPAPPQPGPLP